MITDFSQVTPAWLTATLRESGALPQGEVIAVESSAHAAFNSFMTRLSLAYSADAPANAPHRLLLKRNKGSAWAIEAGASEVTFYTAMMPFREDLPMLVPCYAAAFDEQSDHSFLLLKDLSESHTAPLTRDQQLFVGEYMPAPEHVEQIVTALARFHAYWWQHPLLGTTRTTQVGHWQYRLNKGPGHPLAGALASLCRTILLI